MTLGCGLGNASLLPPQLSGARWGAGQRGFRHRHKAGETSRKTCVAPSIGQPAQPHSSVRALAASKGYGIAESLLLIGASLSERARRHDTRPLAPGPPASRCPPCPVLHVAALGAITNNVAVRTTTHPERHSGRTGQPTRDSLACHCFGKRPVGLVDHRHGRLISLTQDLG